MLGFSANVMIVPNERPWKTIQDFIADAKAKPGSISFGSVGIGSAVHMSSEKFRLAAGFQATHVPYRGGSEVITDILGGRIDFYFCPLATALPLIKEGRVKALVVSTAKRVRCARSRRQFRTDQGGRHQTVGVGLRRQRVERMGTARYISSEPVFLLPGNPHEHAFFANSVARPETQQPHHGRADVPVFRR